MPIDTLLAFGDHGKVTGATAEIDPSEDLKALADAGIDMDQVTAELLEEGVDQFVHALDRLLEGIEERRAAVLTGQPSTIQARLPEDLVDPVAERVKRAVSEKVAERVWL